MTYLAITREQFADKRWIPYETLDFARSWGVLGLTAMEMPRAACTLPIGLHTQADGAILPVALCGVDPERNHFIARDGRWLGGYLPARLRIAPFALAEREAGERILCVEETAVVNGGDAARPFYAEDGELAPTVREVCDFLTRQLADEQATARAAEALADAGLLRPWEIAIATQASIRRVEGLQCVDEEALNGIGADELAALRDNGALGMAYCLLISMQHLPKLGELADAHAAFERREGSAADAGAQPMGGIDLPFLGRGEILGFP